jgi:hypothetical protein
LAYPVDCLNSPNFRGWSRSWSKSEDINIASYGAGTIGALTDGKEGQCDVVGIEEVECRSEAWPTEAMQTRAGGGKGALHFAGYGLGQSQRRQGTRRWLDKRVG